MVRLWNGHEDELRAVVRDNAAGKAGDLRHRARRWRTLGQQACLRVLRENRLA